MAGVRRFQESSRAEHDMSDARPNDHDHPAEVPDLPETAPTWVTQHPNQSVQKVA